MELCKLNKNQRRTEEPDDEQSYFLCPIGQYGFEIGHHQ